MAACLARLILDPSAPAARHIAVGAASPIPAAACWLVKKMGHNVRLSLLHKHSGNPLTALVDSNGNWTALPGTALADGAVVKATDTTSNLTATEVVDATPPTAPAAALAAISDSGTLGDSKTNDTTPTLSGTGTPGDGENAPMFCNIDASV